MEIGEGKYSAPARDGMHRFTAVDARFSGRFDVFHNHDRSFWVIQDKAAKILFRKAGSFFPRAFASIDLDADGDWDIVVQVAEYGTHAGREIFLVLLNKEGAFVELENPIAFEETAGQEHKAGRVTWVCDRQQCAVFEGEEAEVSGNGSEEHPILIKSIFRVREVWAHDGRRMKLVSKSSTPIDRENARDLTFR